MKFSFSSNLHVEMDVFKVCVNTVTACYVTKQFGFFMPSAGFDSNYFWELKGVFFLVWQILVAMYSCLCHLLYLKMMNTEEEEVLAKDLKERKHVWNSPQSAPQKTLIIQIYLLCASICWAAQHMLVLNVPAVSPADLLSPSKCVLGSSWCFMRLGRAVLGEPWGERQSKHPFQPSQSHLIAS